jgi:predicted ABC-type ATPase
LPVLTIIAGPNGAGKSTHSKDLLVNSIIEAFDFDKEFYSIWSQFSYDTQIEPGAFDKAQALYDKQRLNALQMGGTFAFETTYHTNQVLSTADLFRANGYLWN